MTNGKINFALGITNYERLSYLKKLISTWENTKSDNNWWLIIADDGSDQETQEYFNKLKNEDRDYNLSIIRKKDVGVHNLTNDIFKKIDGSGFDFCFKVDNDIYFKEPGWDLKYYDIAMKTGYHHLLYCRNSNIGEYVKTIRPASKKLKGIPMMYGCFFTTTQKVLDEVGYFDVKNFGKAVYGHWDYSIRCCVAGFNDLKKQYDIGESKRYIEMQGQDGNKYIYTPNFQHKMKRYSLTWDELNKRLSIIYKRMKNKQ